jgi:hypothetical protein
MKSSLLEASLWSGMNLRAWLALVARNRFAIRPGRWPMAAAVTAMAAGNSLLAALQTAIYGRRARAIDVPDDPVFIIGHWRTGTTMLHELLALDPANRCPTTYESLSPNHFLLTEQFVRKFARFLMPRTRPFDNMRMSFDRPQEDEAALALRGVPSPFLSCAFPSHPLQHAAYVDLDGLPPRQLARWQAGFRKFLQLVLFHRPGRLVLKSPQHTNRVPVLNAMFPRARFIYLVRDPYVVFPSTVHFWTIMYERYGLQRHDASQLRERVFVDFAHMHERVEQTRTLIDPERFFELRYEHLVEDPVAATEAIYESLDLGDFAAVRPALEQDAERRRRYRTNEYALDAATREEISRRWAAYVKRHGYATSAI